jgi:hypothetical protein
MGGHYHFTIPEQFVKKVTDILKPKAENHQAASFIVQAIIEKDERESFKPLDDFVQPQLELDSLPRIFEILKREDLKDLSDKDVGRLYKIMHMNLDTVRKIMNSSDASQEEIKARLS